MPSSQGWNNLSNVADICGIAGLIFSVAGLILSIAIWKITGTLKEQIIVYEKSQQSILTILKALRDNIRLDDMYTISVRSDLRTQLYQMLQNFSAILTIKDRRIIRQTIRMIDKKKSKIDSETLCSKLDYIIARFHKKETLK